MNRLERQLRILKIAAVVLAVLAVIMALAPRPAAQQASETMRVRQLIVEDAQGRARLVLGPLDAPGITGGLECASTTPTVPNGSA